MAVCEIFFRNDDVNAMEPGLREVTALLGERGVPVSHAVEPANLTDEVRDWLLSQPAGLVEIIQHGYAHRRHDRGEFGGLRSADDQRRDLVDGLRIMRESFGDRFFPAMSFPFGSYNGHTPVLLDELGYQVVSCHWRHDARRRAFAAAGRLLGKGRLLDRHVPHHLGRYPGTRMMEISVTIAPIRRYLHGTATPECEFREQAELEAAFAACSRYSPVVGVVLHHRYRDDAAKLDRLARFVDWLAARPGTRFVTMQDVLLSRGPAAAGARGGGR